MKRFILFTTILIAGILVATNAKSQTISLGERTPRLKNAKWLNGNQPAKKSFTYIEFIHSASYSCRQSTERVHKIINEFDNIAFILVSHENALEIENWVTAYTIKNSGVIINDKTIRTSFGVNYAPYAVLLDHKRRALWFGNPYILTRKTIEKLIQK